MSPLAHDPSSPQLQFDEAVKLVKILAARECLRSPRDGEAAYESLSQTSEKGTEAKTADIDLNDLAHATGNQTSESDLRNILNAFEFNVEERGLPEETSSGEGDAFGARGESELISRRGSLDAVRTSSENLGFPPDRRSPFLKVIAGMITLTEVATAIVLAVAFASWLSVRPYDPTPGALVNGSVEGRSSGRSAMSDTPGSPPVGIIDFGDGSARQESDPSTANRLVIVTPPISPATEQPNTLHPSPEPLGSDEARSNQQDLVQNAAPALDRNPSPLRVVEVMALADQVAGQVQLSDHPASKTERPNGTDVQTFTIQNGELERPSSPNGSLSRSALPHEAEEGQTNAIVLTSSISARPPGPQPLASPSAIMSGSATAEPPSTSIWKAEETLRRDRAAALSGSVAFLRGQTQVLRLRAEQELRMKMIKFQGAIQQPIPKPTGTPTQETQDHLGSGPELSSTSNMSREQRLILRAESLLNNSDISGARLILEKAAADGSARATYLLAQTYDPRILQDRWHVQGIKGDPVKAQGLYSKAQGGSVRMAAEPVSGP